MAYSRKKVLIVDGYNVLRSGKRYKGSEQDDFTHDSFNARRERLINDVAIFAGNDYEAVIVFDGAQNDAPSRSAKQIGNVSVVFSPQNTSADHVIEKYSRRARERGRSVVVVSSDETIQDTVFGRGVDRMSSNDFSLEMDHFDQEELSDTVAHISTSVKEKNTLGGRLSPHSLAALKALRDSL